MWQYKGRTQDTPLWWYLRATPVVVPQFQTEHMETSTVEKKRGEGLREIGEELEKKNRVKSESIRSGKETGVTGFLGNGTERS